MQILFHAYVVTFKLRVLLDFQIAKEKLEPIQNIFGDRLANLLCSARVRIHVNVNVIKLDIDFNVGKVLFCRRVLIQCRTVNAESKGISVDKKQSALLFRSTTFYGFIMAL
jgi:hypothetical protein